MSEIDRAQVEVMAAGLGEDFLKILGDFELKTRAALAEGEGDESFFHQVKGAAGSLGLKSLAEFSSGMEDTLRQGGRLRVIGEEGLRRDLGKEGRKFVKCLPNSTSDGKRAGW